MPEITDKDYEFLANCTDIEFNNWCVRYLNKIRKSSSFSSSH